MSKISEQEAAQELANMTPQDYIQKQEYIEGLEDARGMPEAPASVNIKFKTGKGLDLMYTMRGWDDDSLIARMESVVTKLEARGTQPSGSPGGNQVSQPEQTGELRLTSDVDPSVVNGDDVEVFEVTSLTYQFSGKTPNLNVRGGVWTKYGWRAWPEVIPDSVDYGSWTIGEENTNVPAELRYAFVNKERKKIVAFASSI